MAAAESALLDPPGADDPVSLDELGLVTDLYQLTMLQTYFEHGLGDTAVFELAFRKLPETRGYLVAAGVGTALAYLARLRFPPSALAALESTGRFEPAFLAHLGGWRFSGEVWAIPEGTPVFPQEPLVQVIAPLPEAQLVETLILNQVHFQTLIASKAARVVRAAAGRPVIDFGLRRAHGIDAGMKAVRAGFVAGVESTSNVLGGLRYGVPLSGTMAHSAVEAVGDDLGAFRAFAETDPGTVCLVDTFDTLAGVDAVIALRRELGDRFRVSGIRLDSGDLGALAREARQRLDGAGLGSVRIFASGGLDEYEVERLVAQGAPIDGFGVGTSMDASVDAPAADAAYKLVEYAGQGRLKLSSGKRTLPGRKQVRRRREEGLAAGDVLTLRDEPGEGLPLLRPVMRDGRLLPEGEEPLGAMRARCRQALAELPPRLHALRPAGAPYPVAISAPLLALQAEVVARLEQRPGARAAPSPATSRR